MSNMGRPKRIGPEAMRLLKQIVSESPTATVDEVTRQLIARTGRSVHAATVRKALREAGIERARPAVCRAPVSTPRRYGYTATHRRELTPEQGYASCLTDTEWALVADLFEPVDGRGKPPQHSRRAMVNACCYVVRTGCSWRSLPNDFPHWDNVYKTFRRWSEEGRFEAMFRRLRGLWRARVNREEAPTAGVLDAQSTRGSAQGGETGYDAGKKVKGRKRNLVVDTLGLLLAVSVTAASVQDRDAADAVVGAAKSHYASLQTLFVDGGYAGECAQNLYEQHGITVNVVRHPATKHGGCWHHPDQGELLPLQADVNGFVPLPKRWVVERTHAWNDRARRLIMHHDRLPKVAETWVWLAEARLLLRRLVT